MSGLDFAIDVIDVHKRPSATLCALGAGLALAVVAFVLSSPFAARRSAAPARVAPAAALTRPALNDAPPVVAAQDVPALAAEAPAPEAPAPEAPAPEAPAPEAAAAPDEPAPAAEAPAPAPRPGTARPHHLGRAALLAALNNDAFLQRLDRVGATAPLVAPKTAVRVNAPIDERLDGVVDTATVERVMRQSANALRSCYERASKTNATLRESLTISFTVGVRGDVRHARVVPQGRGTASTHLARCTRNVIRGLLFPPAKQPLSVSRTIGFRPR